MHFNMTVILTYSPPMTIDYRQWLLSDYFFRTYLQVIRCIGEEKPALVLYR